MERFDESALVLGRCLGLVNMTYETENVNRKRPPQGATPEAVRRAILERSPRDAELYRWAEQRLDATLAAEPIAPWALRAYGAANRVLTLRAALRRRLPGRT
jgi:hypothetical protein